MESFYCHMQKTFSSKDVGFEGPEVLVERQAHGFRRAFVALRHRNFRLFWFGQLISQVGTWMQRIGQSWLVLELTHSPQALGLVTALQFFPILLFSLFAGVWIDRVPKHRMLVVTQAMALVQALLLAIPTIMGTIQLWQIYVLAALLGLISAFDNPARQSFVMEM